MIRLAPPDIDRALRRLVCTARNAFAWATIAPPRVPYPAAIGVIGLCVALASCQSAETPSPRPNVLVILTDDQGWGDLGTHGNAEIQTPVLDAFAAQAVNFKRFYVSPVCAPTRASLLTGRYHLSTGTSWVTHRLEVMRTEEVTLPELLKPAGYRAGIFGKWHNGAQYPHDPIGQGFDTFFGFCEGHLNNYFDTRLVRNFTEEETKGYIADILTDEAIAFMKSDEPFFCYVAYNTPHGPFQVPDRYFDRYKAKGLDDRTAAIYGMVENIDDNVGRLLQALTASGKEEETIVIFLSDNGPSGVRYNGGFKGTKGSVDEGGVRVPFFLRYPAAGLQNREVREMAAHIDVLPTLADLLGIDIPDSLEIHGRSLVPLMHGKNAEWEDRHFFTHQVIRTMDTIPGAVRNNRYLLTLHPADTMLFDLSEDPLQKDNLMAANPDVAADLLDRYGEWFRKVTAAGMTPQPVRAGYSHVPSVLFPAQNAGRYGNIQFKGGIGWANDWLIDWHAPADSARWTFVSVAPRVYEVAIQAASIEPATVVVRLDGRELIVEVPASTSAPVVPNRDRHPRGEVEERRWPETLAGPVEVSAGDHSLSVHCIKGGRDFELKGVVLRNTGPAEAGPGNE